jgi:molecular chaperone HtpG
MTNVTLPAQITVGSFFLETLTTGMYEDAFHCIREYVQNSFDSLNDAVAANLIKEDAAKVTISVTGTGTKQSISIRDNGAGASLESAIDAFVSLGASHKRPQKHAGFRGIGRLAGIAYCTTLRFTTKAAEETESSVISFDCAKLRGFMAPGATPRNVSDVIRESVTVSRVSERKSEHFTEVEMVGLTGTGIEFAKAELLTPYLSQYCPTDYSSAFPFADQVRKFAEGFGNPLPTIEVELRVKRDRIRITKAYKKSYPTTGSQEVSALTRIEPVGGKENGWFGWFGISNFPGEIPDGTVAGVRFRQKNIQIGDSAIIESIASTLTKKGSDRRLQRWAVGEIFVVNTGVVPNARRDGFEDNEAWRNIKSDVKTLVAGSIVKHVRATSKNRNALKKASKVVAEKKAKLEVDAPISPTERHELDEELEQQLVRIEKAIGAGADAKEASDLVSQIKTLREDIRKLPPLPPGKGGAVPSPEVVQEHVLAIVRQVLIERLGRPKATSLIKAIKKRLKDKK